MLSEEMYEQVLSWLCEHALKHNYVVLVSRITSRYPGFLEQADYPTKHAALVRNFLELLQERPLPVITNPMFLLTLYDALVKMLSHNDRYLTVLTLAKAAGVLVGVKYIHVLSLMRSSDYDKRDVRKLLDLRFPVQTSEGDAKLLKLKDNPKLAEQYAKSSVQTRKRILERMDRNEQKQKLDSSIVKLWDGMSGVLQKLCQTINDQEELTALERLEPGLGPFLDFVLEGVGSLEEQRLIEFFNRLVDLRMESQFWLSLPS